MAWLLTSCRGPTRFPHPTSLPLLRLQVHTIAKKFRKFEPEHLGAGRCEKCFFSNWNLFRNGYYVHPGAGQAVAGDPGGGRCVFCVFKKIFLCVCVLIFKKIILFVCVDFFKYNYFLMQNKCVFWRFLKTVFFCCKTGVCFDFFCLKKIIFFCQAKVGSLEEETALLQN